MSGVYESIMTGLTEAIEDAKNRASKKILLECYIENPCATLSIPYWKQRNITIPPNMKIVHEREYKPEMFQEYNDELYFRLIHDLKEGILEWIQVIPAYRGKKIGQLIVNELLKRMVVRAEFATVSGKVNNITNPQALYRRCGFTGDDVWHILTK